MESREEADRSEEEEKEGGEEEWPMELEPEEEEIAMVIGGGVFCAIGSGRKKNVR